MKKYFLYLAISAGMIYTVPVRAQLPNMILIEEATNASCGPCAAQNPVFHQFLDDHSDAVINASYHASWPGNTDPMYTNDISMNTTRITYYGFDKIGVPTCVVNGRYATSTNGDYTGAPGDVDDLALAVDSNSSLPVPVSIMATRFTQSDSEQVKITVNATENVTNAYLRVIVVEDEHDYDNAGNNGETQFFHIARKMLPSYTGTKLTLSANTSKTFFFKYKYNTTNWSTDQLRIIAFVQAADKSVLGAVQTTDPPAQGFVSGVADANGQSGFRMFLAGNPANPEVKYTLSGSNSAAVKFSYLDLLGREVLPSHSENILPGNYTLPFRYSALAAGSYHVIARIGTQTVDVPVVVIH